MTFIITCFHELSSPIHISIITIITIVRISENRWKSVKNIEIRILRTDLYVKLRALLCAISCVRVADAYVSWRPSRTATQATSSAFHQFCVSSAVMCVCFTRKGSRDVSRIPYTILPAPHEQNQCFWYHQPPQTQRHVQGRTFYDETHPHQGFQD